MLIDAPSNEARKWMQLALTEARRGLGLTSPNPPVGAVVVAGNKVVGRGYHQKAGEAHAEVNAIRNARGKTAGATIYVTLEPCSTTGRTGPCTGAIVEAGIKRVVFGATDPNPKNQQRAEAILRKAGVAVLGGVMEEECRELIRPFTKWAQTGVPYVIAKAGQSLDGRISRPPGESQWLTSEAARAHARRLRRRVDAILVGAETVRQDNPKLTVRDGDTSGEKQQPWRVVLTRSGNLPAESHLFTDEHKERTVVLKDLSFTQVLAELGKRGIVSVLVEGGGNLLSQAFHSRSVDEVHWYLAPMLIGGGQSSLGGVPLPASVTMEEIEIRPIGDNVLVRGRPQWPELFEGAPADAIVEPSLSSLSSFPEPS